MKLEKIFERSDGSRVKMIVSLSLNFYENTHEYLVTLFYTKGKGKVFHQLECDSYTYLRLSKEERKAYEVKKLLEYVSPQELLETKMELWELLKPTF